VKAYAAGFRLFLILLVVFWAGLSPEGRVQAQASEAVFALHAEVHGLNTKVYALRSEAQSLPSDSANQAGTADLGLYHRAFGDQSDPTLIFLHGGPGYNAAGFEAVAAPALAEAGFHVIVYDRRGEGRSLALPGAAPAAYTAQQSTEDLRAVLDAHGVNRAIFLAHSFGSFPALWFQEAYPERVQAIVLTSAALSLPASFRSIRASSRALFTATGDSAQLKRLALVERMDTSSLSYASFCLQMAMSNGFYKPDSLVPEAVAAYERLRADTLSSIASQMSFQAPMGFWHNERYTAINWLPRIRGLSAEGVPIYALYGMEDGLYSEAQVRTLQRLLGNERWRYWQFASHNVFLDRPETFVATLREWFGE
jgi:proline iminopeptidase